MPFVGEMPLSNKFRKNHNVFLFSMHPMLPTAQILYETLCVPLSWNKQRIAIITASNVVETTLQEHTGPIKQ